jgi:hypothetical protein
MHSLRLPPSMRTGLCSPRRSHHLVRYRRGTKIQHSHPTPRLVMARCINVVMPIIVRAVSDDERMVTSAGLQRPVFSFDAETDGLYGAPWAIGAVVLDLTGEIAAEFTGQVDPDVVTDPWVRENIVPVVDLPRFASLPDLLEAFWEFWLGHRDTSLCVADFGAPVEAGLFRRCVKADLDARRWLGPYPMHELGTALLLAGLDPDVNRRELAGMPGLVQHDPRDDALAAGRCWQIATGAIGHPAGN